MNLNKFCCLISTALTSWIAFIAFTTLIVGVRLPCASPKFESGQETARQRSRPRREAPGPASWPAQLRLRGRVSQAVSAAAARPKRQSRAQCRSLAAASSLAHARFASDRNDHRDSRVPVSHAAAAACGHRDCDGGPSRAARASESHTHYGGHAPAPGIRPGFSAPRQLRVRLRLMTQ
jgi:hypothetical protein